MAEAKNWWFLGIGAVLGGGVMAFMVFVMYQMMVSMQSMQGAMESMKGDMHAMTTTMAGMEKGMSAMAGDIRVMARYEDEDGIEHTMGQEISEIDRHMLDMYQLMADDLDSMRQSMQIITPEMDAMRRSIQVMTPSIAAMGPTMGRMGYDMNRGVDSFSSPMGYMMSMFRR